jgi:hypothetical protein
MLDYLQFLLDRPWKPISRPAIIAWLAFYVIFLGYAFSAHGGFLFIDSANLVVHEGGHNLFGWFGPTLGLWGGTLLQWLVPFLLAMYFFGERQPAGFVFCLFFFFENWLYTATYMADARAQELPLVTTGDPDFVEHDFHAIFSSLGVLDYDTRIALVVRILGWCGMLACVAWLALRLRAKETMQAPVVTFPKPAIPLIQRYPGKPRTIGQVSASNENKPELAVKPDVENQGSVR